MERMNYSALVTAVCILSGCGGGGSSSAPVAVTSPPVAATNQSAGGIWSTQYTITSGPNTGDVINAVAFISENGQYFEYGKNTGNGCAAIGFGQLSVNGNNLTGSGDYVSVQYTTVPGVTPNCVYPDGSNSGKTTISGNVSQRATATITGVDTTSRGSTLPAFTTTFSFSKQYLNSSSLSAIAGNYNDSGATLNINANGVVFEQDANGCVINGQVSIINATYNAYAVTLTVQSCTGGNTALNGVTLAGLITLDTSQSPNSIAGGVSANVSGSPFAEIFDLPKM